MIDRMTRLDIATSILAGLIAYGGSRISERERLSRIAFQWAEALLEVEDELYNPISVVEQS